MTDNRIKALLDDGIITMEDIRNRRVAFYGELVLKWRARGMDYSKIRTDLITHVNKKFDVDESDLVDEAIDHLRIVRGEEGME